jgi:Zn ribbon nucleic-acid-binding protein
VTQKSHEIFLHEVYEFVQDEYIVLGEYKNTKAKIKIRHNICNTEFDMTPNNFLRGHRCPNCRYRNLSKSMTTTPEKFKQKVFDLVGGEYNILEKYTNSKIKILFRHNKCKDGGNFEFKMLPATFIHGERCPKCFGKHKKTTEKFKQEVFELVKDEYSVLENYTNTEVKILMKHNKCGNEYFVTPHSFLDGRKCPKCFGTHKKPTEEFKQEVLDLVSDEYTVLGEYVGTAKNILIKHNKCGNEFKMAPISFLRGQRCPKCGIERRINIRRKSQEKFEQEVYDLVKDEYLILENYVNDNTKILMKHNHNGCDYTFKVRPHDFLGGSGCPKCNESKGEKSIRNYLKEKSINFITEYTFKDCKYKRKLPFDFYLPDLNICIEYDGQLHYPEELLDQQLEYYKNSIERTQITDPIKTEYCNSNSIKLIRIKYDEDINKRLENEIIINKC